MRQGRRSACVVALAAMTCPTTLRAVDFVPNPPARQTLVSPAGSYELTITLAELWRQQPATGTLHAVKDGRRRVVWQRRLPQPVRPRFALVADDGRVVLFDQFDNVKGPFAVLLIDPQGHEVVRLSFKEIVSLSGQDEDAVVRQARYGAWIRSPPAWVDGEARVGIGAVALTIDMATGRATLVR